MRPDRTQAAAAIAADSGAAALVVSDPASLRWLAGDPGNTVAAVVSAADAVLIAADGTGGSETPACDVAASLAAAGVRPEDTLAVDGASLALGVALGGRRSTDVGERMGLARAVKDAAEVEAIRAAAELASAGQRAVRDAIEPGIREIELWSRSRATMEALAGAPVHAVVDLMFGARTELVGVPPGAAVLADGDLVLFDVAPQRDGYWGDSCATLATGPPPADQRRAHEAARRALDHGIAAIRPGLPAGELDSVVRGTMAEAGLEYPHHSGHGVGLEPLEQPLIVPGADAVLEEGMVIALEPGAYGPGFGVRVEHLLLVRAGGAEVLTSHSLDFT
jgi:Xaa-Pro aminopeptidase